MDRAELRRWARVVLNAPLLGALYVAAPLQDKLWQWMLEDPLMTQDGPYLVPKVMKAAKGR